MKFFFRILPALLLLGNALFCTAQTINPLLLSRPWPAGWIAHPAVPGGEYGVFHFRKTLELPARPDSFVVHVSADNRYKLYVNGRQVSLGPARGDRDHWFYETVNLAPHLKAGKNVLAAVVWNGGEYVPYAQMTYRTAFILQGNAETEQAANTGPGVAGHAEQGPTSPWCSGPATRGCSTSTTWAAPSTACGPTTTPGAGRKRLSTTAAGRSPA
jgi:hypothetical protein